MSAAVPLYGALPLLLHLADGGRFSLAVLGVWFAVFGSVLAGYVQASGPSRRGRRRGRVAAVEAVRQLPFIYVAASAACTAQWLLFSFAASRADVAVVTIVYEFHPLLFAAMVATPWFANHTTRLRAGADAAVDREAASRWPETLVMLLIAGCGVALTTVSEQGRLALLGTDTGIGVLAALAAALLAGASSVVSTLTGVHAGRGHADSGMNQTIDGPSSRDAVRHRTAVSAANLAMTYGAVGVVVLVVAAASGSLPSARQVLFGLALGVAHGLGTVFFLAANQMAAGRSDVLIALTGGVFYCVPVVALAALWISGRIELARPTMLLAGASGVVAVNMVMHLDPEGTRSGRVPGSGGHGFRAIVLSLWAAGVVVVFRDDWLGQAPTTTLGVC